MESNKEEAIRARDLAEQKMQRNDFAGAQKVALRAQKIYPALENITHLLAVCDVHRASEQKIASEELDWYGILQIEQRMDDSLIKKQYRKLALLLHPDKNKYYGAEAAFKLVGEAQKVLSDPIKRQMHDTKRRAALGPKSVRNLQQNTRESSIGKQHISRSSTRRSMMPRSTNTSSQPKPQQSTQARSSSKHGTFITNCPFCKMAHHFSIPYMDKVMCCLSCKRPFVSQETSKQTKIRRDQSANRQHVVPSQTTTASSRNPWGNVCDENVHPSLLSNAQLVKNSTRNSQNKSSTKVNDKRKRSEIDESCESILAERREDASKNGSSSENKVGCDQNAGIYKEWHRRRSTQPNVSCPVKMAKGTIASGNDRQTISSKSSLCFMNQQAGCATDQLSYEHESNQKKANPFGKNVQEICKSCPLDEGGIKEGSVSTPQVESYNCQDMNYNDFNKIRDEKGFTAGQVWALYHPFDTMPRFYVIVKAVYRTKFKLRIVWLEPDPDHDIGVEMGNCNFPRSWGMFVEGTSDMMANVFTFSHQMIWEKGGGKNKYKIYPRKGETWAIFKNWDISLDFESFSNAACKFELIEVLSGFVEGLGVSVVYLGKVKGFTSIFCPIANDEGKTSLQIPPEEMSRFSHKIPSFQMLGEEKKGIPMGSIELDPAAIPPGTEVVNVPGVLEVQTKSRNPLCNNNGPITATGYSEKIISGNETGTLNNKCSRFESDTIVQNPTTKANENPEPEFYAFEVNRTKEKFQLGQVWAIYGDSGIPRHYGRIKSIISSAEFQLEVNRLVPCPDQHNRNTRHNKWMPPGCGKFKLSKAKPVVLRPSDFSHHLSTASRDEKSTFLIFPRVGEVWALYKNWNVNMRLCKTIHCEYDIVEVLGEDDLTIEVLLLQRVSSYESLFKCQVNDGSKVSWRISQAELLRFSHHIPAFRLTDEKQGTLRGLWELDPRAVPQAI